MTFAHHGRAERSLVRFTHNSLGNQMRLNSLLRCAVLGLSLVSCKGKALDRDHAKATLLASPRTEFMAEGYIQVGLVGEWCKDTRANGGAHAAFEAESLVKLTDIVGFANGACNVELTLRGDSIRKAEKWREQVSRRAFRTPTTWLYYPAGRYEVEDVTGLSQAEGDAPDANVEFRWKEVFNARALAARRTGTWPPALSGVGRAKLRRYDDGWRVESVELMPAGLTR